MEMIQSPLPASFDWPRMNPPKFRYFVDANGTTIELANVYHDGHVSTKAHHFIGTTPDGRKMNATRAIERKRNPSMHRCDARCMNARGHLCECSCGGKNHGAGNSHDQTARVCVAA
jgi:hypothetical protein